MTRVLRPLGRGLGMVLLMTVALGLLYPLAMTGVVQGLFEEHRGRLEWHAPWHTTHTTDALLRGHVDPLVVDAWLAEQGLGWLTLKDNGALPATVRAASGTVLDPADGPPRIYHLMPRGISSSPRCSAPPRRS